jgi:hypothetical protein
MLLTVLWLLACGSPTQPPAEVAPAPAELPWQTLPEVDDFALLDHAGAQHQLSRITAPYVVLFTYGVGCPIARQQLPTLAALAAAHPDVAVLLLDGNPQDDRAAVAAEVDAYDIAWPVLVDERQLVSESLQVTRTAEALVLAPDTRRLVWRGPIDDRLDYGTQRPASRHYLAEVLAAVSEGRLPDTPQRPPKGCLVSLPDSQDARMAQGVGAPTFTEDVAPILQQRCQRCHRPDGVAPWAMTSYEVVRGWAPMMREVIRTRRMPPWQADPHVGRFRDDLSLLPQEARTIVHWAEEGTPRGDGDDPLATTPLDPIPEWAYGEPDLVVELPTQELPATGILPYRRFELDPGLDRDVWVRAAQLEPGNVKVLHHGTVLHLTREDLDMPARKRKAKGGSAFKQDRVLTHFVPGGDIAEAYPPDTGKLLRADEWLHFTLHYTTTGRPETDRTRLGLWFLDAPPSRQLEVDVAIDTKFRIPPRAARHPVEASWKPDGPVLVHKVLPHMHLRGHSFHTEVVRADGRREPVLSVPAYDFNWQRWYVFDEPLTLAKGDRIHCRGVFDNSADNPANPEPHKAVRFGAQTLDEMFIGYVTYERLPRDPLPTGSR